MNKIRLSISEQIDSFINNTQLGRKANDLDSPSREKSDENVTESEQVMSHNALVNTIRSTIDENTKDTFLNRDQILSQIEREVFSSLLHVLDSKVTIKPFKPFIEHLIKSNTALICSQILMNVSFKSNIFFIL